jgi:hypothetical protein
MQNIALNFISYANYKASLIVVSGFPIPNTDRCFSGQKNLQVNPTILCLLLHNMTYCCIMMNIDR